MNIQNYTFSFESTDSPEQIFETLLNVRSWWSGLYSETIEGQTNQLNSEFTFSAGDGAHYSKQKLIELIPNQKITWLVTDSKLSFLEKPDEWTGTKLCFDMTPKDTHTLVRFTHLGLVPQIECYKACSGAWSQYMQTSLLKLLTISHGQSYL